MKRKSELLQGIENIQTAKILKRNTAKIELQDGTKLIRLHETNVVTFNTNGTVTLNSGGWRTSTTKERINEFSPVSIYQLKGIWYLQGYNGAMFYDGITINPEKKKIIGKVMSDEKTVKESTKMKAKISKFVSLVTKENCPMPDGGDCWDCALHTKEGVSMGDAFNKTGHLLEHIREGYLHGSLLVNAMRSIGYNDRQIQFHYSGGYYQTFKKALRKYLQKALIKDISVR